jgi:predicted nucleic-acid-binding Zn-ribbon protein
METGYTDVFDFMGYNGLKEGESPCTRCRKCDVEAEEIKVKRTLFERIFMPDPKNLLPLRCPKCGSEWHTCRR